MFKFLNYLKVDSGIDLDDLEMSYTGDDYRFTESGFLLLPIGEEIPLIQGNKCIALAKIKSITINDNDTTEVIFELRNITRELANAYTLTYRQSAQVGRDFADTYATDLATPIVGEENVNLVANMSKKSKRNYHNW